jgi:hypothetical protein
MTADERIMAVTSALMVNEGKSSHTPLLFHQCLLVSMTQLPSGSVRAVPEYRRKPSRKQNNFDGLLDVYGLSYSSVSYYNFSRGSLFERRLHASELVFFISVLFFCRALF